MILYVPNPLDLNKSKISSYRRKKKLSRITGLNSLYSSMPLHTSHTNSHAHQHTNMEPKKQGWAIRIEPVFSGIFVEYTTHKYIYTNIDRAGLISAFRCVFKTFGISQNWHHRIRHECEWIFEMFSVCLLWNESYLEIFRIFILILCLLIAYYKHPYIL